MTGTIVLLLSLPISQCNDCKYLMESSIKLNMSLSFSLFKGFLYYDLLKKFLVFKKSNILFIFLQNVIVTLQSVKLFKFNVFEQYSSAFATLKLKVWVAKLTFIFSLWYLMCLVRIFVPTWRPIFSCIETKILKKWPLYRFHALII